MRRKALAEVMRHVHYEVGSLLAVPSTTFRLSPSAVISDVCCRQAADCPLLLRLAMAATDHADLFCSEMEAPVQPFTFFTQCE